MVIDLLCVLDDGSPRRVDVPSDPRRTIRITRGASVKLRIAIVTPAMIPVAVAGATVALSVKKRPSDDVLIGKTGTAVAVDGPNRVDVDLVPNDTRNIEPGDYVFDIWYTAPGGARDPVMGIAPWIIDATTTPIP